MTGAHRAEETARTPEELRDDLGELRAQLGDTVEELAHRADIPARARATKDQTVQRLQEQVAKARDVVDEKARALRSAVQEQPTIVAAAGVVLVLLLTRSVRRRRRRRP
ncbi:DUF3618 domain-containing protein [Pseudonocardia sp.]|uniref:DUF3618 domain-containing protein n=1 Tax=Pseudonocardia sp. TaxID=60912 RepID=UPI002620FDE7|nr:DUF3618 domain-containing protein [Pseudonocardia sp.]MCW2716400.1 hypothetical protein [Pseudonocardia sp.]MDT7614428.1 hypothetical protein [Pseudonocardiales bacterium]